MPVKVKICGITNLEDALFAVECGADALGFVFAPSPRQVTPEEVIPIVSHLPASICKVGVFVNSNLREVREVMESCQLDFAQLHGSESPEFCQSLFPRAIKSFQVRDRKVLEILPHYQACAYLLDAYHPHLRGGTGESFDWQIAREAKIYGKIILSGGLNPANVRSAIEIVQPDAVDVSSGVEDKPGKKDLTKLKAFIETAKSASL
jgi:phosphoribosylanthranilate isomerase